MKLTKVVLALAASAVMFGAASCTKKSSGSADGKKVKIGIAKIVQHVALDSVEQGIIDVLKENGVDAEFDLQNANGDVNTAAQIAMKYRDENVDVAVGIATPVAQALAKTLKDTPVVFGTVTDPEMGDEIQITVIATGFDKVGDPFIESPSMTTQVIDMIDDDDDSSDDDLYDIPDFLKNRRSL